MDFPQWVHLKKSRRLQLVLLSAHGLAWLAVFLLTAWVFLRCLAALGLLLSYVHISRTWTLGSLLLARDGTLCWQDGKPGQAPIGVSISRDSTVWGSMILLRLQPVFGGGRKNVVILKDSVSASEFRVLQWWLRWVWRESGMPQASKGFSGSSPG